MGGRGTQYKSGRLRQDDGVTRTSKRSKRRLSLHKFNAQLLGGAKVTVRWMCTESYCAVSGGTPILMSSKSLFHVCYGIDYALRIELFPWLQSLLFAEDR